MFLNDTYTNICFIENSSFSVIWQSVMLLAFLFVFCSYSFAQWVNNPELNTRLVVDALNPINISSVEDLKGGTFIFWEENRNSIQNEIYFVHVDANGNTSFRSDGKTITDNNTEKSYPVASSNLPNSAVVIYKSYSGSNSGDLFAQKVINNGTLLWGSNGIRVTNTPKELLSYSLSSDAAGNSYISCLTRDVNSVNEYELYLQKISPDGKVLFRENGIPVYSSAFSITQPEIIADEKGGALLFWLENQSNRSVIYGQRVDSNGKFLWGRKGLNISGEAKNVISYSVKSTDYSSIYIAWQVLGKDKDIYHQLIGLNGKFLWDAGGRLATPQKGNQVNPQVLTKDSTIILSWTNEIEKDRNVFIQKYNKQGKTLWNKEGIPVVELKGAQFGQKIITDGKGGAITAWIDRRVDSLRGNIYAQRITVNGKLAWDAAAIPVASHTNTEKSYLSVVSDNRGGAIFIFKDRRNGKGEIYGQKIFNTGTYISQIIGFNAEGAGDSVKITWYSANETGETQYDIERTTQSDSSSTTWELIGTIYSDGQSSAKFYEYLDKPDVSGTIYYRVIQSDDKGNFQPSDISKINFMESSYEIVVAQNSPNPFNDETRIEFFLPEECRVSIEFFNSRVEEIKKIEKEIFPGGKNSITFSADGLEPGIYFYRFRIGDFVDVKKMVISE